MLAVEKVFVIHTKTGLEYRRQHIEKTMGLHGIDFEFMLDGDVSDISEEVLDRYFSHHMHDATPRTSCALKHIYVFEKIVNTPLKNALVLEDDVILHNDFTAMFNQTIQEIEQRKSLKDQSIYIDYDNSTLEYISGNELKENHLLYQRDKTRGTGGYFINHKMAQTILTFIQKNKCYTSIDLLVNDFFKKADIPMYWCQPPLIEQASNNGMWESSIGKQSDSFFRKVAWRSHKFINENFLYKWFKK